MKSNVEVNFEINAEDMEILKNFNKIESYGESGIFRYTAERRIGRWKKRKMHGARPTASPSMRSICFPSGRHPITSVSVSKT